MPYINAASRAKFADDPPLKNLPNNAGELNYLITCMLIDYVNNHGKSYAVINEAVGALECAKLEFYRRLVAPYEDKKIADNGDVYF